MLNWFSIYRSSELKEEEIKRLRLCSYSVFSHVILNIARQKILDGEVEKQEKK